MRAAAVARVIFETGEGGDIQAWAFALYSTHRPTRRHNVAREAENNTLRMLARPDRIVLVCVCLPPIVMYSGLPQRPGEGIGF